MQHTRGGQSHDEHVLRHPVAFPAGNVGGNAQGEALLPQQRIPTIPENCCQKEGRAGLTSLRTHTAGKGKEIRRPPPLAPSTLSFPSHTFLSWERGWERIPRAVRPDQVLLREVGNVLLRDGGAGPLRVPSVPRCSRTFVPTRVMMCMFITTYGESVT